MEREIIAQLAECIGRHVIATRRDGEANSAGHIKKIDEDARAIHALVTGTEWTMPLHGLEK